MIEKSSMMKMVFLLVFTFGLLLIFTSFCIRVYIDTYDKAGYIRGELSAQTVAYKFLKKNYGERVAMDYYHYLEILPYLEKQKGDK